MFIEIAELLCCPGNHDQVPCIVAPDAMEKRRVLKGTIACPECKVEYKIDEGIVGFGEDPLLGTGSRSDDITVEEMPDAGDVQALLNLSDPGGYVVLFGSGCRIAEELAGKVDGVHFIGFNPPPELRETEYLSLIRSPLTVPLMDSCVRGVLVGQEYVRNRWLNEASRVLYGEGRLVAVFEQISPDRVKQLAVGNGMWVGEKEGVPGERAGGSGPSCAGR